MAKNNDWVDTENLTLSQKIAIKLIILAIQILSPYKYSHQFEKQWDEIKKDLGGKNE